MKIVLAPDSFKGSMNAQRVCQVVIEMAPTPVWMLDYFIL